MSGNTFGKLFSVTTFGESHGLALGGVVDGCPPGLEITEADLQLQLDLDLRKPGTSRYTTQRKEPDQVRIISGTFEGKTTGTPIGLMIDNVDRSGSLREPHEFNLHNTAPPTHSHSTYPLLVETEQWVFSTAGQR